MPIQIHLINLILVGVILLPNLLVIFFPPVKPTETQTKKKKLPKWWRYVLGLEQIGRLGIFVLPLFWQVHLTDSLSIIALVLMGFCLLIYYICWIRYLIRGRTNSLLFQHLLFIPVPMAVFPVLYFFFAGILLRSWPVAAAAVVFALGHIPESIRSWRYGPIDKDDRR